MSAKAVFLKALSGNYLAIRHLNKGILVVDGTKVGFGHQLRIVSLMYGKRAIPIVWTGLIRSRYIVASDSNSL